MILSLIFTLLLSPTGDYQNLKSNEYEVREQATRSLKHSGVISLPFLYLNQNSTDKEQKKRSAYIITHNSYYFKKVVYSFVALWLFYGPDESHPTVPVPPDIPKRYLTRNRHVVYRLPYECLETMSGVIKFLGLNIQEREGGNNFEWNVELHLFSLDQEDGKLNIITSIDYFRFKTYGLQYPGSLKIE
jgi:hypothetical protein